MEIDWSDKVILVVEDEPMTYRLIEVMLRHSGVKLLKAVDGKEAIDICKSKVSIDLVLMDIGLPQLNGYEATKKIKKIRPKLPVVAQTAYVSLRQKESCFQAGCDGYIPKPYNSSTLIGEVSRFFLSQ